jgi:UDP-N-acetylglucosamine acyltransferase
LAKIHPLSVVHPKAELAEDVEVGPFCNIEQDVQVGLGSRLDSHVTLKRYTVIGENNFFGQGAIIGGEPQDRKFGHERSYVKIGNNNVFREYVTIHRATGEDRETTVANDCYLMAYVHLGHNVALHDWVTIANAVNLGGHVTLETLVTVGGMSGIHQFVRVGKVAMVGAFTKIVRDVPPFCLVDGPNQDLRDINAVGLRRIGVTPQARLALHKAVKLLFKSQLGLSHAIETVRREVPSTDEVEYMLAFQERLFRGKNGRGDQP